MHGSLLISTFEQFDEYQWKDFELFVRSPYFNKELDKNQFSNLELFQHIFNHRTDLDGPSLSKLCTFESLFPATPFRKNKLEKLMSALLDLVRKFLSLTHSDFDDPIQKSLNLAKFYRKTNWQEKFNSEIEKLKTELSNSLIRDTNFMLLKWQAEQEIVEFENIQNKRKGDLNLPKSIEALDSFYIFAKLKLESNFAQQQKFITITPPKKLVNLEDLPQINSIELINQIPLISIYDKILKILNSTDNFENEFREYQELLKANSATIPMAELKSLYTYLRNFCTYYYNAGDSKYLDILFDIHLELIGNELIYESGKIPHTAFTNITIVGLKLKRFDWVKSFLSQHENLITGTEYPSEVFDLNHANFFFHIKKYDEAWQLLSGKYEDPSYNRSARRMEIKILFEQKDFDLLDYKINAFKAFISRLNLELISDDKKGLNNAFINYLSQILNPSTLHNPARILKIKQKIVEQKAVAEREWLLEKIEELLQK